MALWIEHFDFVLFSGVQFTEGLAYQKEPKVITHLVSPLFTNEHAVTDTSHWPVTDHFMRWWIYWRGTAVCFYGQCHRVKTQRLESSCPSNGPWKNNGCCKGQTMKKLSGKCWKYAGTTPTSVNDRRGCLKWRSIWNTTTITCMPEILQHLCPLIILLPIYICKVKWKKYWWMPVIFQM